jgi:hypothetical protein
MPHTNGSHSGIPSTLGDAYFHAPVWIARPSASGPHTNPTAYTQALVRLGRRVKIARPVTTMTAVSATG